MPKLPDDLSFGRRPLPRPGAVPNIQATGRGITRAADIQAAAAGQTGTGLDAFRQSLDEIGRAETRIQSRHDAVSRARDLGLYTEKVNAELLRVSQESDLSALEVADGFNEWLRGETRKTLQDHNGSAESRLTFAETLEKSRTGYAAQAAGLMIQAQDANVAAILSGDLNNSLAAVSQSPGALGQERIALRESIRRSAGALTSQQERTLLQTGDSLLAERSIETLLIRGDIDGAERQLLEQPGLLAMLQPPAQKRLFDKIFAFRVEERKAEATGIARRAEVRAMLGPGATEDDVTAAIMEAEDFTAPPEKMVQIGDPNSPTGTRWVRESQAEGQAGPQRAPLVSITEKGETAMAEALGKLDAKRVMDLEEAGQKAYRTIAELDRMDAAIQSGRFSTGVFSDARSFLANFAVFVGSSPETLALIGNAATADTLDAASARLSIEAAGKLSRLTNMSLVLIRDSVPNLTRTPEGNKILIEVMRRTSQREIELASLADAFIQDHGTLRPEGQRTFFQAVRDLEENDPVITEELRDSITEGGQAAPNSFSEVFGDIGDAVGELGGPPELTTQDEVDVLEPGTEFMWHGELFVKGESE